MLVYIYCLYTLLVHTGTGTVLVQIVRITRTRRNP